eukprot:GEMP01064741.1.p1 GENE.GEMP01064741.1~~GEMP01064741.1.p1  ORF type:complete len:224 (+),score=58.95 GEMP01064741.1:44-715(+)
MGKRFRKGGGRQKRKVAIKAHDPESKVRKAVKWNADKPPSKKDPSLIANVFAPKTLSANDKHNAVPIGHQLPVLKPEVVQQRREAKEEKRKKKKDGKQTKMSGESRKHYQARMKEENKKEVADARRKMVGDQRKQKVKKHNLKRQEKNKKKPRSSLEDEDRPKVSAPQFGDVVDRPLVFDPVMKAKLDAKKTTPAVSSLDDYVSKVKEAYEGLKQIRAAKQGP